MAFVTLGPSIMAGRNHGRTHAPRGCTAGISHPYSPPPFSNPLSQPMPQAIDERLPVDQAADPNVAAAPQPQEEPFAEAATDTTAKLQAEVEKWKDLALRTAAELDNFRKRSSRDMQDARAYANADLL